jgi:oxygen-independent coproporphyrinogen-3 oxidase
VETLVRVGYRWYETANFCRPGRQARHNLGYWLGQDYLGVGIGAVSTVAGLRWRNRPSLAGYLGALAEGRRPPREEEALEPEVVLRGGCCSGCASTAVELSRVDGAVGPDASTHGRLGLAERGTADWPSRGAAGSSASRDQLVEALQSTL